MDFYIIKATAGDFGVYYRGYPYSTFQLNFDLAMRFKSKKSAYAVINKKKPYFKNFSNIRLVHYVAETVCVNVAKESPWMYENSRLPLSEIEKYQERKVMDMMLRELCKRTDLLQRTEHPDFTTFYMEVLKLDDRPIPTLAIPREYAGNPFEEVSE